MAVPSLWRSILSPLTASSSCSLRPLFGTAPTTSLLSQWQSQSRRAISGPSAPMEAPPTSSISTNAQTGYNFKEDMKMRKLSLRSRTQKSASELARINARSRELNRNQTRNWRQGDVYAPRDMMPGEMTKWRRRKGNFTYRADVFDALNVNPKALYLNFSVMSDYVTSMGRIKHSSDTGLRPVNQRRISKAVRRAIGMGLIPSSYRHPQIILHDMEAGRIRR